MKEELGENHNCDPTLRLLHTPSPLQLSRRRRAYPSVKRHCQTKIRTRFNGNSMSILFQINITFHGADTHKNTSKTSRHLLCYHSYHQYHTHCQKMLLRPKPRTIYLRILWLVCRRICIKKEGISNQTIWMSLPRISKLIPSTRY